mgnify:CR=1 FL=1
MYLWALCFISCSQTKNEKFLDKNLYSKIKEYQSIYPIPDKNPKKRIFVYHVNFWKEDNDTIVTIQRSSAGIAKDDKGYGIFQSEEFKPTFIYDEENLGKNFIFKKMPDKSRDAFYWKKGAQPESFPPVYKYIVRNRDLKLMKIDTVWTKWD